MREDSGTAAQRLAGAGRAFPSNGFHAISWRLEMRFCWRDLKLAVFLKRRRWRYVWRSCARSLEGGDFLLLTSRSRNPSMELNTRVPVCAWRGYLLRSHPVHHVVCFRMHAPFSVCLPVGDIQTDVSYKETPVHCCWCCNIESAEYIYIRETSCNRFSRSCRRQEIFVPHDIHSASFRDLIPAGLIEPRSCAHPTLSGFFRRALDSALDIPDSALDIPGDLTCDGYVECASCLQVHIMMTQELAKTIARALNFARVRHQFRRKASVQIVDRVRKYREACSLPGGEILDYC